MAIKGNRGTSISFHEGDKAGKIVVASGTNRTDIAQDLMEIAHGDGHSRPSRMKSSATCTEERGRIVVSGHGGNRAEAISAIVDALFLSGDSAEAELAV